VYKSPVFADGLMIAMCGYGGSAMAIRPGGSGDVTEKNTKKNDGTVLH
jgi:hypothetical protein